MQYQPNFYNRENHDKQQSFPTVHLFRRVKIHKNTKQPTLSISLRGSEHRGKERKKRRQKTTKRVVYRIFEVDI